MVKKSVFLFFCFFSGVLVYAQNEQLFNLPPGAVLHPKANTSIDYSHKLEQLNNIDAQYTEENFLKEFTEEQLVDFAEKRKDAYQYYMEANKFYVQLSSKVKALYTTEELWYIYIFDKELTEKIKTIK
jgi:hypothetical protein